MRKKYFLIAGIVILVLGGTAAVWGWYLYNKPHQGVTGVKAKASIDAKTLYDAFNRNEDSANRQFLGGVLEITGLVTGVSKTDSTYSIALSGGDLGGINCGMAANGGMPVPDKNATVTIKGRCTGYLVDVNMVDCVIEKIENR